MNYECKDYANFRLQTQSKISRNPSPQFCKYFRAATLRCLTSTTFQRLQQQKGFVRLTGVMTYT